MGRACCNQDPDCLPWLPGNVKLVFSSSDWCHFEICLPGISFLEMLDRNSL
uniref:Uncharacterized protein n=1 Tax=Arundo donax TaxID=35708 RepID=A0A0A9G9B5_ARUDO